MTCQIYYNLLKQLFFADDTIYLTGNDIQNLYTDMNTPVIHN